MSNAGTINSAPGLVDARGLAKYLGVSIPAVRLWTRQGKIKALRLGNRCIRYRIDQILAAFEAAPGEANHAG